MTKHLYIIAGCNGAGKTTASQTILPKSLLVKEFVNADEIAHGLSPFNPEGVAIEASLLIFGCCWIIVTIKAKGWLLAVHVFH